MGENDVKIYLSKNELARTNELAAAVNSVMLHRKNGNIEKARRLGEVLATITPTGNDEDIHVELRDHLAPKFFSPDILYQIKVLLVFACESLLQLEVPTDILSTAAISAMYAKIENTSPGFYKNITDGAEFSFYYLAVEKDGELCSNIGETFAMLCSVKNKESFIEAGKTVWKIAVDLIEKEIEKVEFRAVV